MRTELKLQQEQSIFFLGYVIGACSSKIWLFFHEHSFISQLIKYGQSMTPNELIRCF